MTGPGTGPPAGLAELSESARATAWERWRVIAPAVAQEVSLTAAAAAGGVPVRTAQRWLARYRADGLAGLARASRADEGRRRIRAELVSLIEGLTLTRPRPSLATITRRAERVAEANGWPAPSYSTVRAVVTALDPQLVALAHSDPATWRDRYELALRRQSGRPNECWQADHTELDILVLDADRTPVRPWLTVIEDDCSRAVAGYTVFAGAPSALNLSLALRQAIWTKPNPAWPVHGIPEVLYADHGSDFISTHLAQAALDLRIRLVHSTVGRPQGRGKLERFFGTITTELLPELPGHLVRARPASAPALTLPELDAAVGTWITGVYHQRSHSETHLAPAAAWLADGWLPRTPASLEDLDLLLVMVAAARTVHRDGIRFEGQRYLSPVLAPYVGQPVMIRYDPRDLAEIRVFHRNTFLCRAINTSTAGHGCSLKEIQAARIAHRRALRAELAAARAAVAEYLPTPVTDRNTAAGSASEATSDPPRTSTRPPRRRRPTPSPKPAALAESPARPTTAAGSGIRLYQSELDPSPGDDDTDDDELTADLPAARS